MHKFHDDMTASPQSLQFIDLDFFIMHLQWNPSIEATIGEENSALERGVLYSRGKDTSGHNNVAFLERLSLHQVWLLRGVLLY